MQKALARILFCGVAFVSYAAAIMSANAAQRPNVLLIAIDDLNDWVGFLNGHPQVKTPNMDRLAKRGIVFSNAHCAAPLCCPSRAALFSGKQPFHTGIYDNSQNILRLRPDTVMLTQPFSTSGYRTFGTGKILHKGSSELFDEYFSTEQRWSPFSHKREVDIPAKSVAVKRTKPLYSVALGDRTITLPLNRMPSDRNPDRAAGESFDWGPFDVDDAQMGDGRITTSAIEQLTKQSEKPLFLAVGYYRPHIPLWAPQKYFDLYPEESIVLPNTLGSDLDDLSNVGRRWAIDAVTAGLHETVVAHKQWKPAVRAYLACVSFVDAQIGRLLDTLDNSAQADNTVIVLFSDHGWHLGEKQHWGKWTGWERSTRVPLVIVPPRRDNSAYRIDSVCTQPVGLIDLYPTLLDLCGLPGPDDLDGKSLVASLKDPTRPTEPEICTFDRANYSIRDTRWRFIRYQDGNEEFYDHNADPHEFRNLARDARYDEIRQTFTKRLPEAAVAPAGE